MQSAIATIIAAIAAVAGFVGGYNSRAAKHAADIAIARLPEIRRAIPVEIPRAIPVEIRRAIPVEPEIKKAIAVQSINRGRWHSRVRERARK
jgi:hypothetical protein